MNKKQKSPSNNLWKSLQPKTRGAKLTVGTLAVLCVAGSAYYAGATASLVNDSAREFVQKYQDVDQRPYRAQL